MRYARLLWMDSLRHLLSEEDAIARLALHAMHWHTRLIIPAWMLAAPFAVHPLRAPRLALDAAHAAQPPPPGRCVGARACAKPTAPSRYVDKLVRACYMPVAWPTVESIRARDPAVVLLDPQRCLAIRGRRLVVDVVVIEANPRA